MSEFHCKELVKSGPLAKPRNFVCGIKTKARGKGDTGCCILLPVSKEKHGCPSHLGLQALRATSSMVPAPKRACLPLLTLTQVLVHFLILTEKL